MRRLFKPRFDFIAVKQTNVAPLDPFIKVFETSNRISLTAMLFFALLFFNAGARPVQWNAAAQKAHALIFQLRFQDAQSILDKAESKSPGDLMIQAQRCEMLFLKAYMDEQPEQYESFISASDDLMDLLKDDDAKDVDPFNGFLEAECLLQQSVLQVKFQDHLRAAWNLRNCYNRIEKNKSQFPAFLPNYLISGAVQCMIGAVPSNYEWLTRLVGMHGSVSKGRAELTRFLELIPYTDFVCYTDDVLFSLSSAQCSLYPDLPLEVQLQRRLNDRADSSDLVLYAYSSLLMRKACNEDALKVLLKWGPKEGVYPFAFIYYRKGLSKLRQLDLSARSDFLTFIARYTGVSYRSAAWQKVAWSYLLEGNVAQYEKSIAYSAQSADPVLDEDKDAVAEARSMVPPQLELLQSRLLYDGGYYERALEVLLRLAPPKLHSEDERLEFGYRKSRILQGLRRDEEAVNGYRQTLNQGRSSGAYYAANSALLLGAYYEQKGRKDSAVYYYRECLGLRHHAYQNSIDQKAKTGLDRLKH